MTKSRGSALAVLALLLGVTAIGSGLSIGNIQPRLRLPSTVESEPMAESSQDAAYIAYVAPRLELLSTRVLELAALGRGKSRNLVKLQRLGSEIENYAADIEGRNHAAGVPARFAVSMDEFTRGMALVRSSIEDARTGFLTLDFTLVAETVVRMEEGADVIREALAKFRLAALLASSATLVMG